MAQSTSIQHALFMISILTEMSIVEQFAECLSRPLTIYGDNAAALKTAQEGAISTRAKHIDIRHHFILDVIKRGDVVLKYIKTEHNPADLMTKNLHKVKHLKFTHAILGLKYRPKNQVREAKSNNTKTEL